MCKNAVWKHFFSGRSDVRTRWARYKFPTTLGATESLASSGPFRNGVIDPVADDDSKVGFAAGLGSYHNSRAPALGVFYRPSDRYQFSLGGSTGNGEHMYNLGFSVGLDKVVSGPFSSKKAMVREIVSLREEVEELRAMLKASLGRGN